MALPDISDLSIDQLEEVIHEATRLLRERSVELGKRLQSQQQECSNAGNAPDEVLNRSVKELDLPFTMRNILFRHGYETVGQLVQASDVDILRLRNINDSARKIDDLLFELTGQRLRRERPLPDGARGLD